MKVASHHIPENLLQAYVCGTLPHPFSVVVAAHVSLCDECRAYMEALEVLGGAVVDRLEPATVSQGLRERVLSQLDDFEPMSDSPSRSRPEGIYPGPVMAALGGNAPRWRPLGGGIRQQVLDKSPEGSLRLLYIPPGMAVPEHGHSGLEMTLVLQGSFHDGRNCYQVGDVEVEDDDGCDHKPQAGPGTRASASQRRTRPCASRACCPASSSHFWGSEHLAEILRARARICTGKRPAFRAKTSA